MKKTGILILLLTVVLMASIMPTEAFIGTGININKHLGDTINFNTGKEVQAAGTALGLAGMDTGVTWGADVDLNTLAGYPYGFGGIGAVTSGDVGYNLGLSMDEAHGTAFDGSTFGIPLAQQSLTKTKFDNSIANRNHIDTAAAMLPFTGFPVI